ARGPDGGPATRSTLTASSGTAPRTATGWARFSTCSPRPIQGHSQPATKSAGCCIKPLDSRLYRTQALHDKPSWARDGKGAVMAEAIAERVKRYILNGGDEDLRRLLGIAETTQEMARSAFRRVGMQQGWQAIDCGCGPIGGLAVMAEMVGPAGRVV